jgi:hypothetical protein
MARRVRIFLKYAVLSKLFFCTSPLTADTKQCSCVCVCVCVCVCFEEWNGVRFISSRGIGEEVTIRPRGEMRNLCTTQE